MAGTPIILAKNIWLDASVEPDYEHEIFLGYRLSDGNRASKWESTQAGTQSVILTVPDADVVEVGAFVLDKDFVLDGATVVIKGAANKAFTLSVVTVATLEDPDPDKVHLKIIETPATKKYWKIEIQNPTETPIIFNAGIFPVINLGANPYSPFDPQLRTTVLETFETEGGTVQKRRKKRKREVRANFPRMEETFYDKLILAFEDSQDNPVWWFFRPEADPNDGVYGYITSDEDFPIVNALREGELRILEA